MASRDGAERRLWLLFAGAALTAVVVWTLLILGNDNRVLSIIGGPAAAFALGTPVKIALLRRRRRRDEWPRPPGS